MATLQDIQDAIGGIANATTAFALANANLDDVQGTADNAVASERATLLAAQTDFNQVLEVARDAAGFPAAFQQFTDAELALLTARATLNSLMAEYIAENP